MAFDIIPDSHALIPARRDFTPLAVLDPPLSDDEIAAMLGYAEASRSASTLRAYATDWREFSAWCTERGASPLPCPPGLLCGYLSALAERGLKSSSIGRRASGIAHHHKLAGHETPTSSEAVKSVLRGIRRSLGTASGKKAPATADIVGALLAGCPDSLIGKRDRALLALGFAGAFRRSELVALRVEDLTEVPDGLRVLIRRSKTDQTGEGQEVAIPRGYKLRPVEAVQTWLAAAEISSGPVFRAVLKGGRVQPTPLRSNAMVRMLKTKLAAIGLDPAAYSGHSLRSGYLTSCAETGASLWKMAAQSRHRSLDTLRGYVRVADLFKDHSGAAFL